MAGKDLALSSSDILRKINGLVWSLLVDIKNNSYPLITLDRRQSYCSNQSGNCVCRYDLPCGTEILSLDKERHTCRLSIMLRVLLIIQQLHQEHKHISKRDIYYMDPSLFVDQRIVDQAIRDVCIILKCSRHHLNVVPVGKGLVMGWLRFVESGRTVSCIKYPNKAYTIPVCVEEVEDIASVAQFILVVEKETVFQRLANDGFCKSNLCIIITGRGYPDVPTRRFLRLLKDQLDIPAYCLVDYDPYGFDILTTYRFGSMQMAYDAKLMRVPEIQWLGVFHSDFVKYQFPDRCLLSFTSEDKKRAESMLLRCYLHQEAPRWRFELEAMLKRGVKFEIEALSTSLISFLSEYIPVKIQERGYI